MLNNNYRKNRKCICKRFYRQGFKTAMFSEAGGVSC